MSESTPTGSTTSARGSSSKAAARGGSRRHAGVDVVDEGHRIHEGTGFAAWLFVLPALAVAVVFVIAPFVNTVRLSFTDATFARPGSFVGL